MTREIIYRGRKIELAIESSALADGSVIRREMVLHPGAVVIVPLVDADHVCLLRNQRFVVGETLWELPAGTLEPPESVEHCAARELAEETGYRAGRWRRLAEFYPSPGILSERMYLLLAEELVPGPTNLEKDEKLEPKIVAWKEAIAWVMDGTIHDAKTMIGLLLWDRLRTHREISDS